MLILIYCYERNVIQATKRTIVNQLMHTARRFIDQSVHFRNMNFDLSVHFDGKNALCLTYNSKCVLPYLLVLPIFNLVHCVSKPKSQPSSGHTGSEFGNMALFLLKLAFVTSTFNTFARPLVLASSDKDLDRNVTCNYLAGTKIFRSEHHQKCPHF